jgi:hypothetical protein
VCCTSTPSSSPNETPCDSPPATTDCRFQLSEVLTMIGQIESQFGKDSPLTAFERYSVHQLAIDSYLFCENSLLNGTSIKFSPLHIRVIEKLVRLNAGKTTHRKLHTVAVNQLLSNMPYHSYSKWNHLHHMNMAVVLFRLTFMTLFPEEFGVLTSKLASVDSLLFECFVCSFAGQMDSIHFNAFQDFKCGIDCCLFELKNQSDKLREGIESTGVGVTLLLDVLYAVLAIHQAIDCVGEASVESLVAIVSHCLGNQVVDFRGTCAGVLGLLLDLHSRKFMSEQFSLIRGVVKSRDSRLCKVLDEVRTLLGKDVLGSEVFRMVCNRELPWTARDSQSPIPPVGSTADESVAADFRSIHRKYKSLVHYLNNSELGASTRCPEVQSGCRRIRQSLLMTASEAKHFLMQHFSASDQSAKSLISSMAIFQKRNSICFIDLFTLLAFSLLDNSSQVSESLLCLVKAVSVKMTTLTDDQSIYTPAVHAVLCSAIKVLPFFAMETHTFTNVLARSGQSVYLQSAKLQMGHSLIDVESLCKQAESTFMRKNKARRNPLQRRLLQVAQGCFGILD